MFELTLSQAKQVLVRESKYVRKAVIHRLEKLESTLNSNSNSGGGLLQATQNLLNICIEHDNRINNLEHKVDSEIRVDSGEQRKIQKAVGNRIYQRMDIVQNHENKQLMFQSLYRELKDRFGAASYRDIKRNELTDVLLYISSWIEPADLRSKAV